MRHVIRPPDSHSKSFVNGDTDSTTSVRYFLRQIFFIPVRDLASNLSDPLPKAAHVRRMPPTVFPLLDLNKLHLY